MWQDDDVRPSSDLIEKSHRALSQFRDQALGEDWETVSAEPEKGKKRKVGALGAAALAEANLWEDYDWADQIASGTIHKLTMPVPTPDNIVLCVIQMSQFAPDSGSIMTYLLAGVGTQVVPPAS